MGTNTSRNNRNADIISQAIGTSFLEKHQKYRSVYGTNELYYGIGVENELYLEFDVRQELTKTKFLKNRAKERYSVDYNSSYDKEKLEKVLNDYANYYFLNNDVMKLPILLNSHSFEHGDSLGNQRTTYTKSPQPNPIFSGKTLAETMFETNDYLKSNYDKLYTFDGDTIEFITLNFYSATVKQVIEELRQHKAEFLDNINKVFDQCDIFKQYGKVCIMKQNYPFAVHLTNLNNYGMFNNGTIHVNITLPTFLDSNGNIKDKFAFVHNHRNYAKYIQFVEPLLIAMYGSADVFSENSELFSKGSQRCSVSRYIGVGSFDTDKMRTGKILVERTDTMEFANNDFWWYNKFHDNSAYKKLDQIGMDINFNKHYNHGLEIRIFDHMEEDKLEKILEFLIYLADFILDRKNENIVDSACNPIYDEKWNCFVEKVIRFGNLACVDVGTLDMYNSIFKTHLKCVSVKELYDNIFKMLQSQYSQKGKFSKLALNK